MIFWQLAPSLVAAVVILVMPGLLVARSMGARSWFLAGTALPISVSIIAVTAIICGLAEFEWGVLPVVAVSLLLSLVVGVVRYYLSSISKRDHTAPQNHATFTVSNSVVSVLAVVVPFVLIAKRFADIIGSSENISQTFDNIFHLNAIRYIQETNSASSLLVAGFTSSNGQAGFYPAAWHDVVSLVAQLSNAGIPQSVNATNIVIAALLWPLSSLFLTVVLSGYSRVGLLACAVLCTGFASFPYLMIDFGVLYPNFLSIAVLPAAIALVVAALKLGVEDSGPRWLALALLAALVPGLALAHPSSLLALMPWTLPAVATYALRHVRKARRERSSFIRWWPLPAVICYTLLVAVLWKYLRPEEAMSTWEPVQSVSQAIGQALTSAPINGPVPWAIFVLSLLGVYSLANNRRLRWFLGVYVISCLAFIVVSGYRFSDLRTFVGGIWYNDPYRPAALLPVVALPVATFGAIWLWDVMRLWGRRTRLTRRTQRLGSRIRGTGAVFLCLSLLVVFVGLVQRGAVRHAVEQASQNYKYSDGSPLLSVDERELLARVPTQVGPQETLIASPWTGASLVYALADRKSLTAHVFGRYDESTLTVLQDLERLSTDPEVCNAVRKLNSYYLLDFGTKGVHGPVEALPGTTGVEHNPNFRLIDSEGTARLYRITACGG